MVQLHAQSSNASVLNRLTKYLLITFAAVVALVGIIELILHVVAPVSPDLPTKLLITNKIQGFKEKVTFEVRPDLLRPHDWSEEVGKSDAFRVVCVGGPSTVGVLQNAEDTWWGKLKQGLEKSNPGKKFSFGVMGLEMKGIRFGAKWGQKYFEELQPDLVIVQYGITDVLNHPESYEYDPKGMDRLSVKRERKGLKKLLVNSSQIVRRISRSRQSTRRKLQQKEIGKPNYYATQLDLNRRAYQELDLVFSIERPEGKDPLEEYLEGVKALVSAAREAGSKVLIVGEPSLCGEFISTQARSMLMMPVVTNDPSKPVRKPEPGWVEKELYRYYAHAKEYAKDARVPFVNLHGSIPQDPEYFFNEAILTDAGAAKVAEMLLPETKKVLGQ